MAAPAVVCAAGGEAEEEAEEAAAPRLRDAPEDILLEAAANAIALHPARAVLAAGDVDGDVYLYSFSCVEGDNRELWSSGHHLKSCRDVAFSPDGQKLFTVSKDKSIHILTVEEGRLETRFSKAHSSALNCVLPINDHVFATGDDGGALKVWDLRKGATILEAQQHEEYISAMVVDSNGKLLLTASGDGTLGVFNIKRRRFELLSEPQNGDLTSVVLLKGSERLAEPSAGLRRAARGGAHRAAGRGPGGAAPGQLRPRPEGEVLGHLLAGLHCGGRLPEEEEEGGAAEGPEQQGRGQRRGLLCGPARGAGGGDGERQRRQ
ncbi:WD repeat-containing protein 55 isoform X2 [Rhea pennata]|uniref:WD repeat-containing protein 55 isoform X2 n=1 Tax=Rhea pennata TaxID=8795 RepID=UPI002E25EEDE